MVVQLVGVRSFSGRDRVELLEKGQSYKMCGMIVRVYGE